MNLTLVILAAGMGSRYGGQLKQIDSFGPNNEILMEYSIYDAIKAGFTKVIFVIRRDFEQEFRNLINSRIPNNKIEIEYVFQELTDIPNGYELPSTRQKPRGTAHAVLAATQIIQEPFAVINADDFYGKESYQVLVDFLKDNQNTEKCCIVGYELDRVLSDHGTVSRGLCELDENGNLKQVVETKKIYKEDGKILADKNGGSIEIQPKTLCSMNMMGFSPIIISFYQQYFKDFIKEHINSETAEFYMPEVISRRMKEERGQVAVLPTIAQRFGVTYQEDKEETKENIQKLIQDGVYPNNLWE